MSLVKDELYVVSHGDHAAIPRFIFYIVPFTLCENKVLERVRSWATTLSWQPQERAGEVGTRVVRVSKATFLAPC